MEFDDEKTTFSSTAVRLLREDILAGVILPGTKLQVRELCNRFGMSVSPVREALNQLAAHGLVQHSEQRGFTVASMDVADLTDLTLARVALNEIAVRDAIAHGDAKWEEDVLLAHHRLSRMERSANSAEWETLHRRFHQALIAACRSKRIITYCEQLFDMADRYRIVSRLKSSKPRDINAEHEGIMHAVMTRNADEAARLLREHVETTDALVREALMRP
jgi:DNA-binding GntR family transcriptional regulator